ncbi:MAG: D-aminoacyl-tRNA deacylase [Chromatiales bacterium]|jgi:D-tyrosyl-tRNA(Tyr) deacylase
MIGLLQRVTEASVTVEGEIVAEIGRGILVLVGIEKSDTEANCGKLADRLASYRVFPDESGRMNLSVASTGGGILLVPQFTLAANTQKGTRASFTSAAPPETASRLFDRLVNEMQGRHPETASGIFAADMQVALVNDGPVTFWLSA